MSSSNRVRVALIKETTYGETPVAGDFREVRYTSESLSGTPTTTESQTIRADRQSSGQIVTGLEVGGDLSMELARDPVIDDLMEVAMLNKWNTVAPETDAMDIDSAAKTISRAAGDFTTKFKRGDFIIISGSASPENNVLAAIANVTALEMKLVTQFPLEDVVAENLTITRCDKLEIGTQQESFSMEKKFLDLTNKAINYKGQVVSTMSLESSWGAVMTASFGFQGNDYKPVDKAVDMITNGRTVLPGATSDFLNGSIDMPIIAASATTGQLTGDDMCIQNLSIELDNNHADLTCIGKAAPEGYDAGTARVNVSMSTYLKDESWGFLPKKLTQEPFEILFAVMNKFGGYGFYIPQLQTTSDDPASGGLDQQVSLELEGQAKVAADGSSEFVIYRIPAPV